MENHFSYYSCKSSDTKSGSGRCPSAARKQIILHMETYHLHLQGQNLARIALVFNYILNIIKTEILPGDNSCNVYGYIRYL